MNDDKKEQPFLILVADNPSIKIEEQRNQQDLERVQCVTINAIRKLAVNLLRIIAGAGDPDKLLHDIDAARQTYFNYIDATKKAGRQNEILTDNFSIDHLFARANSDPVTEDDWRHWAMPTDPHKEYFDSVNHAKVELRRAALRQVAAILNSQDNREPHLKAHGGNLDNVIQSIWDAEKRFELRKSRPPEQADPKRLAIAEQNIADLQRKQRIREIQSLPSHQIAGLRAVELGTTDQIDAFTLDVLGRMKLLTRPKRSTKKSAWQLTEDGRLALEFHHQREN